MYGLIWNTTVEAWRLCIWHSGVGSFQADTQMRKGDRMDAWKVYPRNELRIFKIGIAPEGCFGWETALSIHKHPAWAVFTYV